jgi:hypothetical protein
MECTGMVLFNSSSTLIMQLTCFRIQNRNSAECSFARKRTELTQSHLSLDIAFVGQELIILDEVIIQNSGV